MSELKNVKTGLRHVRAPAPPASGGAVILDLQVGVITDYLLLGSEDVAKDKNLLIKHQVTHVLTVADTMKDYKPAVANIKHLFLKIRDLPQTRLHDYFSDAFSFIDECAADGGKVLAHCVAGKSRSASIVIAYMMKTLKMSFDSTFKLVKEKRPGIGPNHGFISQLKEFGEELHKDEF